ncbi:MAG: NADH-quinone oxidoreductase subunit I [Thiovulaceae bacterium]|nr:NADH-quinone oxidoreductase subunit I [Sulfurimonadaceae bacterium]
MAYKIVKRHGKSFKEKIYLPAIFSGLYLTFKHFFKNVNNLKNIQVLEYPEVQPDDLSDRYRGHHRLTSRDDGSIRCVACFMCSTACPADCIFIEAQPRLDNIDEKEPFRFDIDLLECIFCGYCVEACPCDAIRMDSDIFSFVANDRKDFVVNKDQLLAIKGKYEPQASQNKKEIHD